MACHPHQESTATFGRSNGHIPQADSLRLPSTVIIEAVGCQAAVVVRPLEDTRPVWTSVDRFQVMRQPPLSQHLRRELTEITPEVVLQIAVLAAMQ